MKITKWTGKLVAVIAAERGGLKAWKRMAAAAVVGGSLSLAGPADAQTINHAIQDPSFDEVDLTISGRFFGSGHYAYINEQFSGSSSLPDYPWVPTANSWLYNTAYSEVSPGHTPTVSAPRSPDNALHLADSNVFQIITDTFVSGRTYTLSAWIRWDSDSWVGDNFGLRLFDGTLGTFSGAIVFAAENFVEGIDFFRADFQADPTFWLETTLSFTADTTADGKPIGIYLGPEVGANRISVDDVSLTSIPGLLGDFNNDNVVDAADYVWWRKNDGIPQKYDEWRGNFGAILGGGSAAGQALAAAVPEPSTCLLVCAAAAGCLTLRRRSTDSR